MSDPPDLPRRRPIRTARLLSVGSELTSGETVDTNSAFVARALSALGVDVLGVEVAPDQAESVQEAFRRATESADLVVSTGGLGPTPDDLTREAIAGVLGEEPTVDPGLLEWLRGLFERRGLAMSDRNVKQAWLIPSARAIANENGTAPGWWVESVGGGLIVALPGPPRELIPMWRESVEPWLRERGVGARVWARTLRLTGIGESAAADLIGDELLRSAAPSVATYARADAVDVRVVATDSSVARSVVEELERRLAGHIFAYDTESWAEAIGRRLGGRTLALVEVGTGGELTALLGGAEWLVFAELLGPRSPLAAAHETPEPFARRVREAAPADIGLAVIARERGGDMAVSVAVFDGERVHHERRMAFLGGTEGRRRAALVASTALWRALASAESTT